MCSCQQHSISSTETTTAEPQPGLNFWVDDMTCGHCASTIETAIEIALPGTSVKADPASRLVTVQGHGDYAAIKSIVIDAGYRPSVAPARAHC